MELENYKFSGLSVDLKLGLKDYKNLFKNGKAFKNYLKNRNYTTDMKSGRTPSKFNADYWNGDYEFITMSDVDTIIYRLNKESKEKITDEAINNENNLVMVPENSLIISSAMTIGLAFINNRDVFINQNVFWINLNEDIANKKFILWYFNSYVKKQFKEIYSAKYLSKLELSRINIPNVSIKKQNIFEKDISKFENNINDLINKKHDINEIINDVFSKYFKYDVGIINNIRKGMTYGTQSSNNSQMNIFNIKMSSLNDNNARLSARANSPIVHEILNILNEFGTIKTKDIVCDIIHRGKSPDYDKNGTIPVLKTVHITNNGINTEYEEFVNEEFYTKKKDSQIKKGDILLASTGKPSIGKIDIFEGDYKAIPDGHLSIIRIDKKRYNKYFFTYFVRSVLGYAQIEKEFVGCTNQIELYPDSINKMLVPDISLDEQQNIVDEVNDKIKEQKEIENQILKNQKEIEKILFETIK